MQITSKGQITIPKEIRDISGLLPRTEAEIVFEGGKVVIQPAAQPKDRGKYIVEHLRKFATNAGLTTDEIMAMTRGED